MGDLGIGVDYLRGKQKQTNNYVETRENIREFYEITPMLSYSYSKNLKLSAYYARLRVDIFKIENGERLPQDNTDYASARASRFRFEAKYSF